MHLKQKIKKKAKHLTVFFVFLIVSLVYVIFLYQSSFAVTTTMNINPTLLWEGIFTDLKNWKSNNWNVNKLPSWGSVNIEVRPSSKTDTSPHGDNYLRIHYPSGSANSASSPPLPLGGAQFYGAMISTDQPITLSYYLRFPSDFPFDYMNPSDPYTLGKLPGLFGGKGNTGTNVPNGSDGWSTRYMWCDYNSRTKEKVRAGGEILMFTFGSNKGTYGTAYGTHLGCNNWKFASDGKWHNIQQTIHLNTPGKADGRIDSCYDGQLVLVQENITFRTTPTLKTNGIIFQSFFGGSGPDYATPKNTHIDFADFSLYSYPASSKPGVCVSNP